jgi:hypothetical protein
MTEAELAWLTGYLEGEGSFLCGTTKKGSRSISVFVKSTDEDVIRKVQSLTGAHVCGPYQNTGLGKKVCWYLRLSGDRGATLMRGLLLHMGRRRAAQINDALAQWNARPTKGHCLPVTFELPSSGDKMDETAWLAGYLEAEGSFCSVNTNVGGKTHPGLQISLNTTDIDVAQRAAAILGGRVYSYNSKNNPLSKKPAWCTRLPGYRAAAMMRQLAPYMGIRRMLQISASLSKWDARLVKRREPGLAPTCHPERKHIARGLCRRCYERDFGTRRRKGPFESIYKPGNYVAAVHALVI